MAFANNIIKIICLLFVCASSIAWASFLNPTDIKYYVETKRQCTGFPYKSTIRGVVQPGRVLNPDLDVFWSSYSEASSAVMDWKLFSKIIERDGISEELDNKFTSPGFHQALAECFGDSNWKSIFVIGMIESDLLGKVGAVVSSFYLPFKFLKAKGALLIAKFGLKMSTRGSIFLQDIFASTLMALPGMGNHMLDKIHKHEQFMEENQKKKLLEIVNNKENIQVVSDAVNLISGAIKYVQKCLADDLADHPSCDPIHPRCESSKNISNEKAVDCQVRKMTATERSSWESDLTDMLSVD